MRSRSNRMLGSFALLLSLLLAGAARAAESAPGTPAAALPEGVQRVTSVEGVTEYRLANGLQVLLFPDPSKETITVNVTYLVGSRNEGYGETGMAHLLEHMLFKGSTRHTNIPQELTEHGARPNGSTWYDRTNYFETFQATPANLDWALDLEADRMVNSFIAKKDLDSEMTVVRNEYESGENDPVSILVERTEETAYLWHNYGHPTIGARSDIENVPIARLQGFYKTYYQPDNAALVAAGKFDEAATLAKIAARFGAIPRPARELQKTYTVEPTQDGERQVTLRRVGDVQAACAAYHVPAGPHPDSAALDILSEVLGSAPSGRLYKALVETKKASSVFGGNEELREPSLAEFGANVRKEGSLDEARAILVKTVEGFAANPPTKEEVERARARILKGIELRLTSSERVGLGLSEWIAMGDWRLLFLNRDRIRQVTPEDVRRVAAAYLKPSNRTLGLFLPTEKPDRSEIPATPDVAQLLKDYKGSATVAMGEAFDPSPENIERRVSRPATPGGLKLALLPRKTRGEMVYARLSLHFGDEKSLRGRVQAASMAGQMLTRGTTRHTRQQIQDELDRLRARVGVYGGATGAGASIETTRENTAAVLRLVAEILRSPAFPASEFTLLQQERLASLEEQRGEPQAIASIAFSRHLNPYPKGDVRYTPTLEEQMADVKATTLADVKRFYADFYGAAHGELAVVGDFDEKTIPPLAQGLFGGWKSRLPYARVPGLYHAVPAVNKSFETPDKANATFTAGMNLEIRDDDADYPALVLGNYILGGGFLNSRLAVRLRQKEGLSYGAGSYIRADALDRTGMFGAYAIYAPQNAARLEAGFREELARALKDGFTDEEIATAKTGYLQSRQVDRAQDAGLAGTLASYRFLNRTLKWDADFEQRVRALTGEQILAALRKHIVPAKITTMKAGDFAKGATP